MGSDVLIHVPQVLFLSSTPKSGWKFPSGEGETPFYLTTPLGKFEWASGALGVSDLCSEKPDK